MKFVLMGLMRLCIVSMIIGFAGCNSESGSDDAGIVIDCQDKRDCPNKYECIDRVCVYEGEGEYLEPDGGSDGGEDDDQPVVMRDGPCGTQITDPWYPANSIFFAPGHYHACVLLADKTVRCWGQAMFGQVGNESNDEDIGDEPNEMGANLPIVDLGATNYRRIFSGGNHNCVIFDDQRLKCWGGNEKGQLGIGDVDNRGNMPGDMGSNLPWLPVMSSSPLYDLVLGRSNTCALFEDGSVKCWGDNDNGQLGYGNIDNLGDDEAISSGLPVVDLGTEVIPFKLSGGFDHMCVLMMNGKIKCWGGNAHGQLGLGDMENRGDQPGEMGDALDWVDLGSDYCAIDIAAGLKHTCAVLSDGSVKCWGNNAEGGLGLGDTENRGDDSLEMGDNLSHVDLGDRKIALAVGAGQDFSCTLFDDHTVKCWGRNENGQLGQGHSLALGDELGEMGDVLPDIALGSDWRAERLYVGREHVCTSHGAQYKCWGSSLGAASGADNPLGDEPGEMGEALPVVNLP
jgi:alpha-tubulin suppressor-like RCC1 family protein